MLVRRTFPGAVVDSVLELLALYGDGSNEHGRERVQRAIVSLSQGDVDRLLHFLQAAQQDYRDVLHWAQDAAERRDGQPSLDVLRREWSWVLPEPLGIVAWNAFGNVLVDTVDGTVWRVCPEDLRAESVAPRAELDARFADAGFAEDWFVEAWVQMARRALGPVDDGECYGFKIWPVLQGGGGYALDNMVIKTRGEWLAASGAVGRQVRELPDGTSIELQVLDPGAAAAVSDDAATVSSVPVTELEVMAHSGRAPVPQDVRDYPALKRWLARPHPPYVECLARHRDGGFLTALVNGDRGILIYQKAGDASGYTAIGAEGPGAAGGELDYRQGGRGDAVRFPAAWALPIDEVRDAIGYFLAEGAPASWLRWTADGVTPTSAVFWSADVAKNHAMSVATFYRDLGLLGDLDAVEAIGRYRERHGKWPDSSNPWDDVVLLSMATERVWAGGRLIESYPPGEIYRTVLAAWASISLGVFAPTDVVEDWGGAAGPVEVRLRLGGAPLVLRPACGDGRLDVRILRVINRAIEESGYQFAHAVVGDEILVLCLTEDERAEMEVQRLFPFADA